MIVRFVKDHPQHSVELVLRVLGIASSTFYGWLAQAKNPSRRRLADEQLLAEIVDIHTSSGGTYGSPRMHATPRHRGRPQTRGTADAGRGVAGRVPAPQVAYPVDAAGPTGHAGTGSGQPRLLRGRPGPVVGGGRDADPDR
nr:hypothetical protein [Nocardia wallacei]